MSVGTRDLDRELISDAPALAARVDAVYERHHRRVYALALNYGGGDHAWAEDVTQDVFFTLLDKIDVLPDRGDTWPWLRRVTINRCISLQRRRRIRQSLWVRWALGDEPTEGPVADQHMDASTQLQRVWAAVSRLPAKQRAVFSLRHFDDVPQHEIAKALGHSDGYVSKLLHRAEVRVREDVQRQQEGGDV